MAQEPLTFRKKESRPRRAAGLAGLLFAFHVSTASFAQAPQSPATASLKGVSYEDKTLRIRLDHAVPYRVFSLSKPERLVIELSGTTNGDKPYEAPLQDEVLKKIRFAQFQTVPERIARVVLEMTKQVPFQAIQEGNDILLHFGVNDPKSASAPASAAPQKVEQARASAAPESDRKDSISGHEEETLDSAASVSSGGFSRQGRSRDLLATLPKNPVTIDFDDAEISDVLRVLSEMSGINIIHASNVHGAVSVHLDQVPFNEAFETILTMQGLVAQQMGSNILRILTPEDLNTDRARAVVTYKTFTLNYAKASEIQPLLSTVKISPNARAEINDRNNSLIVTDTPEGISAAERLIAELDVRPQQVLIEAKLVEVDLNNELDLGIQWEYSGLNPTGNGANPGLLFNGVRATKAATVADPGHIGFLDSSGTNITENAVPGERGTGVNLPNNHPSQSAITFGFINNTDLLSMTLNALTVEGKTKLLSEPRIITLNNKEARIQVGDRLPFSTVNIGQSGVATQNITFIDVGIILDVTPVINADNRIRLRLKPEASVPGQVTSAGPQISTRNADTEVIIRDGETLVIGGLIDESVIQTANKVPLLGDIPVLGVFFRNTDNKKTRKELLIFVTPRIVRD